MAPRTDRVLTCYRIGDPAGAFPIYDAEGARLYPGRWNTPSSPIIYTSEHYSTAMLEKLVHSNLVLPANQHFITITIPNGISYEVFPTAAHPGWDSRDETICKTYGQDWFDEKRSALLIVPSLAARIERNFLINPQHPEAKAISHALAEPVWWDQRLYRRT
ncbi:RES family NAD+ phosphorylase [Rhizomicrobium electricum]|uniref:RES family NAD+ phosphorylase n=2 Tax=Rhizomicrobium electricum TaxID=480070 RepID=A0ABN1E989_9PROT|nr:RES domain-containing protein [Rhizomicrobium electricum]NIJ47981.1 RES domain-containing protein [Rhizomicrobium electricum]